MDKKQIVNTEEVIDDKVKNEIYNEPTETVKSYPQYEFAMRRIKKYDSRLDRR